MIAIFISDELIPIIVMIFQEMRIQLLKQKKVNIVAKTAGSSLGVSSHYFLTFMLEIAYKQVQQNLEGVVKQFRCSAIDLQS